MLDIKSTKGMEETMLIDHFQIRGDGDNGLIKMKPLSSLASSWIQKTIDPEVKQIENSYLVDHNYAKTLISDFSEYEYFESKKSNLTIIQGGK